MLEILEWINNNKLVMTGAITTIMEIMVIIVNNYKRLKTENNSLSAMSCWTRKQKVLWDINPLNLFTTRR